MHRVGESPANVVYLDCETVGAGIQALIDGKQVQMDFAPLEMTLAKHYINIADLPRGPTSLRHSEYMLWIGARVQKKRRKGKQPKPFKSGSKINTVRGLILHPILGVEAFTFHQDESYVACHSCELVDEVCVCTFDPYDDGDTEESWHYKRTCLHCGHSWFGLHCRHDGVQNPCPGCDVRPTPVPETA